ncbi:MAG: YerC/YecD family TrpR-related protein [Patescibacteria group bacterium]
MKRFKADPFPTYTPKNYPTKEMKELFTAILKLKTPQEAAKFFRDLLTMPEIREFANRWQIVKMLYQKRSYVDIATKLKVSTTTVTRVAHWLEHGFGGYKAIADRVFETKFKDSAVSDRYFRSGKYRGLRKPHIL